MLVFAFLAVGLGSSSGEGAAVAKTLQTPPQSSAVLAIVGTYNGSRLAWLDPATLRPLKRPSVGLPGGAWSPVLSPAGRYVALGGHASTGIRIVDVKRMTLVSRVARGSALRYLTPLAWPERRRLLVLDHPQNAQGAPEAVVAIDPVTGRVLARTVRASVAMAWRGWAPAGHRLVLLAQGTADLGPARLVVFGPAGGIVDARDVGVVAGFWPEGPPSSRVANPGLAVDSTGRSAFVVDPQTLARVDLETLDISYARLAEPRSLMSRLLSWLEPDAQAKLYGGFSRQATWLGDGLLAVSGVTNTSGRSTPAGLQLVDTRTGAVRTLESRASAHRFSQEILLAFGAGREESTGAATGMGVTAFTADGRELWHALEDEPVWLVQTAGGYGYVTTPETSFPQGVRVIDLATGAVLRTVRGEMPAFVVRA
jgi:hypothetical protein